MRQQGRALTGLVGGGVNRRFPSTPLQPFLDPPQRPLFLELLVLLAFVVVRPVGPWPLFPGQAMSVELAAVVRRLSLQAVLLVLAS